MPQNSAKYTFFVDASGDFGIQNVRTEDRGGASRYMTLGATLIAREQHECVNQTLNQLKAQFKKRPHCKKLKHEQKVIFADKLIKHEILCFGLISLKETLGGYRYKIHNDASQFHNKCAQYLLEILGLLIHEKGIEPSDVSICFEKGPFRIRELRRLIVSCQRNPYQPASKYLTSIDVAKIRDIEKAKEPLLETADLIAHSLYRCVDGGSYRVLENRYLNILKTRFCSHPTNNLIVGRGIKTVHTINDLKLPPTANKFFKELKNLP